jgi:translation initiation factor 4A
MGAKVHCCIGGTNVREELQTLKNGVHVVVGTPGRVYDMIQRRALKVDGVKLFVLDEADNMLDARGFQDQVKSIFTLLPEAVQTAVFSATMPSEVLDLALSFMNNPIKVLVKREQTTLKGLKQFYVALERESWKLDTLCDLYCGMTITQSVIFCNTRRSAEWLAKAMTERDFTVSCIHGGDDQDPKERQRIMKEFRSGTSRVLIATDILARGIDVQQVSLVINYDIPRSREQYIHRIGRSARYGRRGVAINFIVERDIGIMRDIETFYSTEIKELPANVLDLL